MLSVDIDDAVGKIESAGCIWFVGTGTSQHAAELAARMFAAGTRQPNWASSAGFADGERRLDESAVLVISHTAETAFARRSRRMALDGGARVVSITGRGKDWPEAIETVPSERSETHTASYTAALLVLARLAVALGQAPFGEDELSRVPGRVRAAAQNADQILAATPERLLVIAGAGPGAVTAREGALKLREAARMVAEGYEAEYLLHGSAVPLGPQDALLAIQPGDDGSGLLPALAEAAASEGLSVGTVCEPDGLHPLLAQIPLTVRLQKLACGWAEDRGVDPDRAITSSWAADRLWGAGAPESPAGWQGA
jgi:glucosamine--fructose-6-phosphate aminotransferase (isomerizing)